MPAGAPNFALLIGKKKGDEPAPDEGADEPVDHAKDLGVDQGSVEDSAIKDLMAGVASKDGAMVKSALQDFLEACYPSLGDDHAEEASEGEDPGAY